MRFYVAPLEELIIHLRTQKDFYRGTPDYQAFGRGVLRTPGLIGENSSRTAKGR